MKISFFSNFLTHHQLPFCLEMQKRYGDDYKFISTAKISEERLNLGYKDMDWDYDFVVRAYENKEKYDEAVKLATESDIVIIGSTVGDDYFEERLKKDKLTFRYRERLFKEGFFKTLLNKEKRKLIYIRHLKYRKNKNVYVLCASAYGAGDFAKFNLYKNKIYKWGYFPENNKYDIDKLIEKKEQNKEIIILWAARFIKWKNPWEAVEIGRKLKQDNIKAKIKMLGSGILFDEVKRKVEEENLKDYIELVGAVDSDKVKDYMEEANIFIFTSNQGEGWGVVLNESLNAGCAVVANEEIGSVPFLIENGENGLIASNVDEFYNNVKLLINNKELRMKLGKNAYKTIDEKWNYINAVDSLQELFDSIINNKELKIKNGPASKADIYIKKGGK